MKWTLSFREARYQTKSMGWLVITKKLSKLSKWSLRRQWKQVIQVIVRELCQKFFCLNGRTLNLRIEANSEWNGIWGQRNPVQKSLKKYVRMTEKEIEGMYFYFIFKWIITIVLFFEWSTTGGSRDRGYNSSTILLPHFRHDF